MRGKWALILWVDRLIFVRRWLRVKFGYYNFWIWRLGFRRSAGRWRWRASWGRGLRGRFGRSGTVGFGEKDRVMLLAGESTRASGHRAALWAAAILHVMEPHRRVLAWGRGDQARGLVAFARAQKQPGLLCVAEERLGRRVEFEE